MIPAGACLLLAPAFGQSEAHSTTAHVPASSLKSLRFSGSYTRLKQRKDENQSAIFEVKQLNGGKIRFHLTALMWPVGHSDTPHNGEIEATVALRNRVAVYKNETYRLIMRFTDHAIVLTESGSNPDFGAYVRATGTYRLTKRGRTR